MAGFSDFVGAGVTGDCSTWGSLAVLGAAAGRCLRMPDFGFFSRVGAKLGALSITKGGKGRGLSLLAFFGAVGAMAGTFFTST